MRLKLNFLSGAILLGATMAVTVPAQAAPVEQISCVYDTLTPDQNRKVLEITNDLMNNRPRKRSTAEKEVSSWIDAAFAQCEKRYGWSPIDRENVVTYTAIFYLHQRFKADPLLSGADFAALDAYALKLRPNGGEGQPTAEEKRAIMTQIAQSGVDASNQPAMTMALDYILSSFHLLSRKNAFATGKLPEVIARDYIN